MPNTAFITIIIAVFLWISIGSAVFVYQKCGWQGFLFGNGALYAAASGACER